MNKMTQIPSDNELELVLSRVFHAPRALVWQCWNEAQHVAAWFGPKGFSTRVEKLDFRVGGQWQYVMIGPDGTEYPCCEMFKEIVPEDHVVSTDEFGEDHQMPEGMDLPQGMVVTTLFEDLGSKTRVTIRILHASVEDRRKHEAMGVVEGWGSSLDCLDEHLATCLAETSPDREIVTRRRLKAPRELVFKAFTDPVNISRWWGPRGFSTTTHSCDLRVGGQWLFTMHGPDGRDYKNKVVYLEVDPPARLSYKHSGDAPDVEQIKFHTTVTFVERGDQTEITLRAVFETPAEREYVVREHGAVEGGHDTLQRLSEHLEDLVAPRTARNDCEIFSTRLFACTPEQMWHAWSDPQALAQWWGPKGFTNTFHEFDFQPGGQWRFLMHSPNGVDFFNHCVFVDLSKPSKIVIDHLADMHKFRIIALFTEEAGQTRVDFRMIFDTPDECTTVRSVAEPSNVELFDRLTDVLATLK